MAGMQWRMSAIFGGKGESPMDPLCPIGDFPTAESGLPPSAARESAGKRRQPASGRGRGRRPGSPFAERKNFLRALKINVTCGPVHFLNE